MSDGELFEPPQPFALHPFQRRCVQQVYAALNAGARRVLFVQPTGTGKTITFSQMVRDCAVVRGRPALVVAHREELIDQAVSKLHQQTGIRPEVEKAQLHADRETAQVVVGSVPTMRGRRLEDWPRGYFGLVVVDECHHVRAATYERLVEHFIGNETDSTGAVLVGCTATPDRGDERNLGSVFECVAFNYPLTTAIAEGYLAPIRGLVVQGFRLDMQDVRVSRGDYQAADLDELISTQMDAIAQAIVDHTRDRERTLIFMPLVHSARMMADALTNAGVRAGVVAGEDPAEQRRETLADFRAGKITHLCNVMVLTEGYDHPAIDCVAICRPTRSRGLFAQMVGRGTRTAPGKEHLRLLNFDWRNAHDLVKPYELFIDNDVSPGTRALAEAGETAGEEVDYEAALRAAVARRHDPDVLRRQLELVEYDPLDLVRLGGHDPESELNIRWRNPATGRWHRLDEAAGSITDKQAKFLRWRGMRAELETLSKAQASMLIDTISQHGGSFAAAREALYRERLAREEDESE